MKALSLWQPWASLVAAGVKSIETRSWSTSYRGPLAIHAAATTKGFDELPGDCEGRTEAGWCYGYIGDFQAAYCYRSSDEGTRGDTFLHCLEGPGATNEPGPCPLGVVVATCTLVDVAPMLTVLDTEHHEGPWLEVADSYLSLWLGGDHVAERVDNQRSYGDFAPGRYAWLLDDIAPTTERCPLCRGEGDVDENDKPDWLNIPCRVCGRAGVCDPIPAKGRQQLWEWVP